MNEREVYISQKTIDKNYLMCEDLFNQIQNKKYIILEDIRKNHRCGKGIFTRLLEKKIISCFRRGEYQWNLIQEVEGWDGIEKTERKLTREEIKDLLIIERKKAYVKKQLTQESIDDEPETTDVIEQPEEQSCEEQEIENTTYQKEVLKLDSEDFIYSYGVMLELIKSGATTIEKASSIAVNMIKELRSNFN